MAAGLRLLLLLAAGPLLEALSRSLPTPRAARVRSLRLPVTLSEAAAVGEEQTNQRLRLGVLLLNLGGPEAMQDVEGFLYNLFADPDIIRLPPLLAFLQKPLAFVIAKRRAPKSSAAYESIGGGSPIVRYTEAQARLLESALTDRGFDARCYFAMRYWHPFTEEALEQVQRDGVNTLVVVPLYPQYSISTSGSSLRVLQELFQQEPGQWSSDRVAHTVVPAWYYRKGYVSAMARLIVRELEAFSAAEAARGVHVLFSAHGVPQSYIAAGDPYQRQIEECVRLVSKEVSELLLDDRLETSLSRDLRSSLARGAGAVRFHLSFQSRVGPVQWLQPYTEEKLRELGEDLGVKNLVVVPVSFVSEHIETLEEIDMEYREVAEHHGITHWRRVPALNTDPLFIQDMAEMVEEALNSPSLSVYEATPINSNDLVSRRTLIPALL